MADEQTHGHNGRLMHVAIYGEGISHSTIWGRWLLQDEHVDGLDGRWSVGLRARPRALVLLHQEAEQIRLDVVTSIEEATARGWPASLWPGEIESPTVSIAEREPEPPEPISIRFDSNPLPPLREIDDDRGADAVELVRREGMASVSMLQRKMSIGHAHAARLIKLMERARIIGPSGPRGIREVYGVESTRRLA